MSCSNVLRCLSGTIFGDMSYWSLTHACLYDYLGFFILFENNLVHIIPVYHSGKIGKLLNYFCKDTVSYSYETLVRNSVSKFSSILKYLRKTLFFLNSQEKKPGIKTLTIAL